MGEVKKEWFLKLIIAQKVLTGLFELMLSIGALNYLNKDVNTAALNIITFLNADMENHYVQLLLKKAALVHNSTLVGISVSLFFLGALAILEGYGLHIRKKWGEWLTVISTSSFIPLEVYGIIQKISLIKIGILIFNCIIVYYLAKHKELFTSRRKSRA